MAYFDSPKNYAFWKKEIEELKKLRADKQTKGYSEDFEKSGDNTLLFREQISLDELIEEETGKKPTVTINMPDKQRTKSMEVSFEK